MVVIALDHMAVRGLALLTPETAAAFERTELVDAAPLGDKRSPIHKAHLARPVGLGGGPDGLHDLELVVNKGPGTPGVEYFLNLCETAIPLTVVSLRHKYCDGQLTLVVNQETASCG